MKVRAADYNKRLSQEVVDEIINNLLVNLDEFSSIACLDGAAYGVDILCKTCTITITQCAREHLIQNLVASQAFAEQILGGNVTPKYHIHDKSWDGKQRIQLQPGISAVNVRRVYGEAESFDISPYILEGLVGVDSGSGFYYLVLDGEFVENPNKIAVLTPSNAYVKTQEINNYPYRDGDGNWRVALGKGAPTPPSAVDDEYNIQHCEYMFVDVDMECEEDVEGEIRAFYPNSNQMIPYAKDPEVVSEGVVRYWFHPWVLLNDAFKSEGANLSSGYPQFSHLLQAIDFRCVSEEEALPHIIWKDLENCEYIYTTDTGLAVEIVDAEKGIIQVDPDYFSCGDCACSSEVCRCHPRYSRSIKIYYKTDPSILGYDEWSGFISEGIAHLAAAELPLKSCKCNVGSEGFIYEAQQPYNKVKQIQSGNSTTTFIDPKVGQLYGQLVFREKLSRVPKRRKARQI